MNSSVLHMLPFSPSKIPLYFHSVSLSPCLPSFPRWKPFTPVQEQLQFNSRTREQFSHATRAPDWQLLCLGRGLAATSEIPSQRDRGKRRQTTRQNALFRNLFFFPYFFIIAGSCGMSFYFESHRAGFFLKGEGREWNTCHDPPCLVTVVFVYFCFVVGFYFFLSSLSNMCSAFNAI